MIISTGMRTDIPAFYSKWWMNRIREGYVLTRNPYNEKLVSKYLLDPKVVDCINFCSKNPKPLLPYIDELKKFHMFWFVTITPYRKDIEPNVPDKNEVMETFKQLSNKIGKNAIGWRYDPIFYNKDWNYESHINAFDKMCENLSGYTNFCVVSVLDLYKKVQRNAPDIRPLTMDEQHQLLKQFVEIGKQYNIEIRSCFEGNHLKEVGVNCDGCQPKDVIEKAIQCNLKVKEKPSQRGGCNCLLGSDIGMYDSCPHLCRYCYANANKGLVLENIKKHDDNSPMLIGNVMPGDIVKQAKQVSYLDEQVSLF